MSSHRVEFTIEREHISGRLICTAPEGAKCRLTCSVSGCDAESWPCFTYHDDGTETEHPMKDSGGCLVMDWFEDPIEYYYDGDEAPLVSGPVQVVWDEDCYSWNYSVEVASS